MFKTLEDSSMQNLQNLLTTKQTAELLNVSEAWLERDRWAGARIPFIRLGARAVRYDPEVIRKYLQEQTRVSTSEMEANNG
jgi:predicted DNA-binding transcriptional regulator AlpA